MRVSFLTGAISESGAQGPLYDLMPGYPAWTLRPDGTWREWPLVRVEVPVLRLEGPVEEIGERLQALRDTCPLKASYEAPEKVVEPYATTIIHVTRWFAPRSEEGHPVLWIGFSVQRSTHPPEAIQGFSRVIPEDYQWRLAQAEKYPFRIEADEIKRVFSHSKSQEILSAV